MPDPPVDPRAVPPSPTVEALLDAAERLVAQCGCRGVSDRAIVLAAGQRNKSVIAYHFGTRQGLLDAVWHRRTSRVEVRRLEHLARIDADGPSTDGRALLAAYLEPMVEEMQTARPSYWARFNEQVLQQRPLSFVGWVRTDLERFEGPVPLHTLLDLFARLGRLCPAGVADPDLRVALVARMAVSSLAAWERDVDDGARTPDDVDAFVAQLCDLGVAMLAAPA